MEKILVTLKRPRVRTWSERRGQLRPFRRPKSLSWGRTWGWTRAIFPQDQVFLADGWTLTKVTQRLKGMGGMYPAMGKPGGQGFSLEPVQLGEGAKTQRLN